MQKALEEGLNAEESSLLSTREDELDVGVELFGKSDKELDKGFDAESDLDVSVSQKEDDSTGSAVLGSESDISDVHASTDIETDIDELDLNVEADHQAEALVSEEIGPGINDVQLIDAAVENNVDEVSLVT